jgi:excisionase family DNA binding protein
LQTPEDILLYDVANLCEAAKIGRTLLYKEIKAGHLRAIKIGGRTLFRPDAVDEWLAAAYLAGAQPAVPKRRNDVEVEQEIAPGRHTLATETSRAGPQMKERLPRRRA